MAQIVSGNGFRLTEIGKFELKGIADTGLLVAFANRNDRHHEWAVRIAERVVDPLLTCEAGLAEAAHFLIVGG